MEKYNYVFNALESIVVDVQFGVLESDNDSEKALLRLERSYLSQVVELLHKAQKCRQEVEIES